MLMLIIVKIFLVYVFLKTQTTFIIYDSDDDGICCESGGSYLVSVCENIYASGGL